MPAKIFFCYAHEDEALLNKLKTHLRPLQRQNLIDIWYDRNISAGAVWEEDIKKHLNEADIILLLISPSFMDSEYCYSIELQRAIERHKEGNIRVIPIILEHIYWQFEPLNKLQALPVDARPIVDASWHSQNEAFYNVAEGIRKVVEELTAKLSNISVKATEQPLLPSIPVVAPLPENASQPVQTSVTFTNLPNKVVPSVNPPFVPDRQEVTDQILTVLPSTQTLKTLQLKYALTGHSKSVNSVAISPDGHTLVSGSDDKTIRVWNLLTGKLLRILKGHTGWIILAYGVTSVAVSPDGQNIVSGGSDDQTVRVWNLHSGELLHTLTGHESSVNSVAISPDGHTLVSGSSDTTVRAWNLHSGELLRTLTGHENFVRSVAISPDGQTAVSGSIDHTVRVWNLHSGKVLQTLSEHEGPVYSVAISPDGQTIVSGSDDKIIRIWSL